MCACVSFVLALIQFLWQKIDKLKKLQMTDVELAGLTEIAFSVELKFGYILCLTTYVTASMWAVRNAWQDRPVL
jgi:hypothetical protein